MSHKILVRIMVLLCIVYGATVGILAMYAASAMAMFAVIGAVVLGLGWTATGMFGRRQEPER